MRQTFTARVWKEGKWFVAQCVEIDIASHGKTSRQALSKLKEALQLYLEPPVATILPKLTSIEVELGAA
jgi:predicted RNase H-like HicB family nuclease